jgi:hypothetical protein
MQASIIDKLIEEALLEFTSLTDDHAPTASKPIDTSTITGPLKPPEVSGSVVNVGSWIDEIAVAHKPDSEPRGSLPMDITAGNLAALEDDEPVPSPPPSPRRPGASAMAPVVAAPVAAALPLPAPMALAGPDKKNGPKVGMLVLLVVLAATAAAWFTGLIPHH